jgi:hypothetical protein
MITNIFCSPIQQIHIKDYQFINIVDNYYKDCKKKKLFKNNWMPGNDTTPTTFQHSSNIFKENVYIKMFLESKCENYLDNLGIDFTKTKLMNSWFNEQGRNQAVGLHNHRSVKGLNEVSGVFYLKAIGDIKQGAITFINHNPYEKEFPINNDLIKYTNEVSFIAKENNLFFFPASLNHKVTTNLTNTKRVVLSFNLLFETKND